MIIIPTNATAKAINDPYWSSVVALLHGEGATGSTTITDSSPLAANWTASGNAQVVTAQYKFGGASLIFSGTSSVAASAASTNFAFGTSDFTIEMWVYQTSASGAQIVYDGRPMGTQTTQPTLYFSTGTPAYYVNSQNRITGAAAISLNTWTHVAVSRVSGTTRMFVDGTQSGSPYTDATSYTNTSGRPILGQDGYSGGNAFQGYMDDVRVTKAGRYSANFTAPISTFLDSS